MYIFTKANNVFKKTCNIRIPQTSHSPANERQCTIKQRLFTEHIQLSKMTAFVVTKKNKPKQNMHIIHYFIWSIYCYKYWRSTKDLWGSSILAGCICSTRNGTVSHRKGDQLGFFFSSSFFWGGDFMAKCSAQGTEADLKPLPGGTKGTTWKYTKGDF